MKNHSLFEKPNDNRDPREKAVDMAAIILGKLVKIAFNGAGKFYDYQDERRFKQGIIEPKKRSELLGTPAERTSAFKMLHSALDTQFNVKHNQWTVEAKPDKFENFESVLPIGSERHMLMFDSRPENDGSIYFLQSLDTFGSKSAYTVRKFNDLVTENGERFGETFAIAPCNWNTANPNLSFQPFKTTGDTFDEVLLRGNIYEDGILSISESQELVPTNREISATEATIMAVTVGYLLPFTY